MSQISPEVASLYNEAIKTERKVDQNILPLGVIVFVNASMACCAISGNVSLQEVFKDPLYISSFVAATAISSTFALRGLNYYFKLGQIVEEISKKQFDTIDTSLVRRTLSVVDKIVPEQAYFDSGTYKAVKSFPPKLTPEQEDSLESREIGRSFRYLVEATKMMENKDDKKRRLIYRTALEIGKIQWQQIVTDESTPEDRKKLATKVLRIIDSKLTRTSVLVKKIKWDQL